MPSYRVHLSSDTDHSNPYSLFICFPMKGSINKKEVKDYKDYTKFKNTSKIHYIFLKMATNLADEISKINKDFFEHWNHNNRNSPPIKLRQSSNGNLILQSLVYIKWDEGYDKERIEIEVENNFYSLVSHIQFEKFLIIMANVINQLEFEVPDEKEDLLQQFCKYAITKHAINEKKLPIQIETIENLSSLPSTPTPKKRHPHERLKISHNRSFSVDNLKSNIKNAKEKLKGAKGERLAQFERPNLVRWQSTQAISSQKHTDTTAVQHKIKESKKVSPLIDRTKYASNNFKASLPPKRSKSEKTRSASLSQPTTPVAPVKNLNKVLLNFSKKPSSKAEKKPLSEKQKDIVISVGNNSFEVKDSSPQNIASHLPLNSPFGSEAKSPVISQNFIAPTIELNEVKTGFNPAATNSNPIKQEDENISAKNNLPVGRGNSFSDITSQHPLDPTLIEKRLVTSQIPSTKAKPFKKVKLGSTGDKLNSKYVALGLGIGILTTIIIALSIWFYCATFSMPEALEFGQKIISMFEHLKFLPAGTEISQMVYSILAISAFAILVSEAIILFVIALKSSYKNFFSDNSFSLISPQLETIFLAKDDNISSMKIAETLPLAAQQQETTPFSHPPNQQLINEHGDTEKNGDEHSKADDKSMNLQ